MERQALDVNDLHGLYCARASRVLGKESLEGRHNLSIQRMAQRGAALWNVDEASKLLVASAIWVFFGHSPSGNLLQSGSVNHFDLSVC